MLVNKVQRLQSARPEDKRQPERQEEEKGKRQGKQVQASTKKCI